MTPSQALEILTAVTEHISPNVELTLANDAGQQFTANATSRKLHAVVGEALKTLKDAIESKPNQE